MSSIAAPAQHRRYKDNYSHPYLADSTIRLQDGRRTPIIVRQVRLTSRRRRRFPAIPKNPVHVPERHDLRYQRVQPRDDARGIEGAIAGPGRELRDPDAFVRPRSVQLLDESERRVGVLVVEVH